MTESHAHKTDILVKSLLFGTASLVPSLLGADSGMPIVKACEIFMGWYLARQQGRYQKLKDQEVSSLEEIELNGHLLGLAATATNLVIESAEKQSASVLGDDTSAEALYGLKEGTLDTWRYFAASTALDGQDIKDLVVAKTTGQKTELVINRTFWQGYLKHALEERHLLEAVPSGFIHKLAGFLEKEFPGMFYGIAKEAADKHPVAFAALQLQFFGALTKGQDDIHKKLDALSEQLALCRVEDSNLKPRQITRLSQVAFKLHKDFEELRPLIKKWSTTLSADIGTEVDRAIATLGESIRVNSERTQKEVRHGTNKVLLALLVIAALLLMKIWWDYQDREQEKIRREYANQVQTIKTSDTPQADQKNQIDEARLAYAKRTKIDPSEIPSSLIKEATELAKTATKRWTEFRDGRGGQKELVEAFEKYLTAGDYCLAAESYEKAKQHYQQALELTRSIKDWEAESLTHRKIASAAALMSDSALARSHRMQAVEITLRSPDKKAYLLAITDLVEHLKQEGELKLALERSKDMVRYLDENPDDFGADRHLALHLHGQLLDDLGLEKEAITFYQKAIQVHDGLCKEPQCRILADYKLDLAMAHSGTEDFTKAYELVEQVEQMKVPSPEVELNIRHAKIRLMLRQNRAPNIAVDIKESRAKDAIKQAEEALLFVQKTLPKQWQKEATSLNLLADAEESAGRNKDALDHYKQTYEIAVKHQGAARRGSVDMAAQIAALAKKMELKDDAAHFQEIVDKHAGTLSIEDDIRRHAFLKKILSLQGMNDFQLLLATLPELEKLCAAAPVKDPWMNWELHLLRGLDALLKSQNAAPHMEEAIKACDDFKKDEVNGMKTITTALHGLFRSNVDPIGGVTDIERAVKMTQGDEEAEKLKPAIEELLLIALVQTGQFQRAIPLLKESVKAARESGGPTKMELAEKLCLLGQCEASSGSPKEALASFQEAQGLISGTAEPWSGICAVGLILYSNIQIEAGKAPEVRDLLEECQRHAERIYGPNSLVAASGLNIRTKLFNQLADHSEAVLSGRRAIGIQLAHPVVQADDLLAILENYSFAALKSNAAAEDQALLKDATKLVMRGALSENAETARICWAVSDNMAAIGLFDEALPLAEKALVIDSKIFGPASLPVARDRNNLSLMSYNRKLFPQAEEHCRQALSSIAKVKETGEQKDRLLSDLKKNYLGCIKALGYDENFANERMKRIFAGEALEPPPSVQKQ